ncbi:MAG: T9SS type A sorting domain-containing protein, partial [Flavobacteriales bacterium]|nr:T9SS type A sorting domain-containing protein [Flavobacteriales bacterium]
FETTDNAVSWHMLSTSMLPASVYDLLIVNDEVLIGTHGRGVWTVSLPELIGYEPPAASIPVGLDISYLFQDSKQKADIKLTYRSDYENIKVFVNEVLVIEYTDVTKGSVQETSAEISVGENTVRVVGVTDGVSLESSLKISGLPLKMSSNVFVSDFNSMSSISDEFYGEGFSISQPAGFDNKAINTSHPYAENTNFLLYLNTPIIVNANKDSFTYRDVALVEPGEKGTSYPHEEFWDYVTVEASTDGQNWIKMISPYDARLLSTWNAKYNNNWDPNKDDYLTHAFRTTDFFSDGDEILVRFNLYSDANSVGWGWIIDDLEIQKDALSLEDNFLATQFKVYPNPVVDGALYLESTTDSKILNIELYNLTGQVLLNKNFANVEKAKLDISNFAKGQYLIKVETDKGAFSKKIMVK